MKEYLKRLPKEILDLIYLARDIASKNNMQAYLVGGFVRDLLLGVKNLDLDIVVEGNGIKFAEDLSTMLKARIIRHERFGTAAILLRHNLKIDIATARSEFYPQPAHLPVVRFGSLRDDLKRRDFSINAMAVSIMREDFGSLIDFFAGKEDLINKRIRILHVLSFIDDPTRILRSVRFEQRYNFKIEPQTLRCLREAVGLKMLERVQPHRTRDELILLLKEEEPLKQLKRLNELALLGFIEQNLAFSKKTCKFLVQIRNKINWFKKKYPSRRLLDTWIIFFLGLTDSFDRSTLKAVCDKFSFNKGEKRRMLSFKDIKTKFILTLSQSGLSPHRIFNLLEPFSYEVIILIKAKYKNKILQRHIEDFLEVYNGMRIYISGEDLHRLGLRPSPFYNKIFTKVLQAKLNGKVRTKEEELALIKKLLR